MKKFLGNITVLGITLIIMFGISEFASRLFVPISAGPSIKDVNGNKQTISYIEAGKTFFIVTPDFSAKTSINDDGYRNPQAEGNPEVLFVGDSFTYAQGVTDEQTFPALYCKERNISCANLGVPGASTLYEVNRLARFIKEKSWSPKMVHFFFFTGNDFGDNVDADNKRSQGLSIAPAEITSDKEQADEKGSFKRTANFGLKYSNLARVAYFKVLPIFRNDPEEAKKSLEKALQITKIEFSKLDKLSKAVGFAYQIYIIHPEPEIRNNVYEEMDEKLQAQSAKPLISLAELFKENTQDYFFPSDGHFTVKGNEKMAEYLLSK